MVRKGYKQTEEHKRKRSEKLKGKSKSEETKIKMRKPRSEEAKKNMRKPKSTTINMRKPKSNTENMKKSKSEETCKKISGTRKRLFKEGKLKIWNYIDGRSKLLSPARYGDDWDKIRYLVYLRDRFTCQDCGIKGDRLDIHHIIPFLIEYNNSLSNLITLCRGCHMKREKLNVIKQEV